MRHSRPNPTVARRFCLDRTRRWLCFHKLGFGGPHLLLKLTKILSIGVFYWPPMQVRGLPSAKLWSLLHPFSSNDQAEAKTRQARCQNRPEAAIDVGQGHDGHEELLQQDGRGDWAEETGTKKPLPQDAYPRPPPQKKKPESKSWFSSWFKPKEPERPKTVNEWMGSTQQINP